MATPEDKTYSAKVVDVLSGDDLMVMVDLGHDGLYKKTRVRLHKVDTPDAHKSSPCSDAGKVREEVRRIVANRDCLLVCHAARKNGWIATVLLKGKNDSSDCVNLNEYLIAQGYVYHREASQ